MNTATIQRQIAAQVHVHSFTGDTYVMNIFILRAVTMWQEKDPKSTSIASVEIL